ncbi:hypothetical protein [Paenibacillus sp. MABNR03]|uniref:hypothetical protein n=1 Tax=Paenibacillus sp. MABNR03 TaxID=3142626 RepID=UPI003D271D60
MKRSRTSRTMMMTSTMALTIALGGGLLANNLAHADPAAGTSAQTKNASNSATNSHTSKSTDGKKGHGLGRYSDELASALGVTADELKEARKAGSTIAEIAASKNVNVQTVIDKLVAAGKSELQQRLSDGEITQTQYDKRTTGLNERVTDLVNGVLPEGRNGYRAKRGDESGAQSDSGSSDQSTSTSSTDPS